MPLLRRSETPCGALYNKPYERPVNLQKHDNYWRRAAADATFFPWLVLSVPSYVDVVDKGQGDHQLHSSNVVGATAAHKGLYGGEEDRSRERYGTAPVRDNP